MTHNGINFDFVKDLGLVPARPYTKRTETNLIILHHFESDASVESVHAYHISRGHAGIDYNIVVRLDGTVVWGRGLLYQGGHVMNGTSYPTNGMNARSIGIAFQGNFKNGPMNAKQLEAGKKILAACVLAFPGIDSVTKIKTHIEVAGASHTDCPGKYFPADVLRDYIRTYGQDKPAEPQEPPQEPPAPVDEPQEPVEPQEPTEEPQEPTAPEKPAVDYSDVDQGPHILEGGYIESGGAQRESNKRKYSKTED